MYLSRLMLNPRVRAVRRDLADCQALHRTVMSLFGTTQGEEARARLGLLHRLETNPRTGQVSLLLQSAAPPDFDALPPGYLAEMGPDAPAASCKDVDAAYAALGLGRRLRFCLLANPTKKVDTHSGPDGQRRNGRRLPLRGEDAHLAWLARKGVEGGFRLLQVKASPSSPERESIPSARALPAGELLGRHPLAGGEESARLTFVPVLFEGLLEVAAPDLLRQTLGRGIGPGKAYGLGLLSLAPA